MAILVSGSCSERERRGYLAHLSGCGSCYRQWLRLSQFQAEEGVRNKKIIAFRLLKRKNLAWAGSALAAAASLVLYLHIVRDGGQSLLYKRAIRQRPAVEMSALEKQRRKSLPGSHFMGETTSDSKRGEPLPSARRVEPLPVPGTVSKRSTGPKPGQGAEDQLKSPESAPGENTAGGRPASLMMEEAALAPMPAAQSPAAWLMTVKRGCLDKEKAHNLRFWQEQYRVGQVLLREQQQDSEDRPLSASSASLNSILPIVERLAHGERAGEPCGAIRALLP